MPKVIPEVTGALGTGICTYHSAIPLDICQTSIAVGFSYSFGPDPGIFCILNEAKYCGAGMSTSGFGYPGVSEVGGYLKQAGWTGDKGPWSWICGSNGDGGGGGR